MNEITVVATTDELTQLNHDIERLQHNLLVVENREDVQLINSRLQELRSRKRHLESKLFAPPPAPPCDAKDKPDSGFKCSETQRIHYADGSSRSSDFNLIHLAPTDELQMLRAKWFYVVGKLESEKRAYNDALKDGQQQADWHRQYPDTCPPPPSQLAADLERGRQRIDALEEELAAINAKLPDDAARAKRNEAAERNLQSRQNIVERFRQFHSFPVPRLNNDAIGIR